MLDAAAYLWWKSILMMDSQAQSDSEVLGVTVMASVRENGASYFLEHSNFHAL